MIVQDQKVANEFVFMADLAIIFAFRRRIECLGWKQFDEL